MKISTEETFSIIRSTEADSLEYTRMAFDALDAVLRPCKDKWNEKVLRGRPRVVWIDTANKTAEYAELVIVAVEDKPYPEARELAVQASRNAIAVYEMAADAAGTKGNPECLAKMKLLCKETRKLQTRALNVRINRA